jgi:hypothetical protein
VSKPKRRRRNRHRPGNSRGGRQSPSHFRTGQGIAPYHQPSGSYRPRDQFSPVNGVDSLDRHISRATETDESLQRYLKLLRFARSASLQITGLILVSCLIFGAGVGGAIVIAGIRPLVALGVGAGGSATFILTVALKVCPYLRAGLRLLSATDNAEWATDLDTRVDTPGDEAVG